MNTTIQFCWISLAIAFFAILQGACKKEALDYEYAVVCDFKRAFADRAFLVATNQGKVVQEIEIPPLGSVQVTERFVLNQSMPYSTFDIHLVLQDTEHYHAQIFSHFGVKNGQSIFFSPEKFRASPPTSLTDRQQVKLRITGLKYIGEVIFPGCDYEEDVKWPYQDYNVMVNKNMGLLIQYQANYVAPCKQLYIPASELKDSISIDVKDIPLPQRSFQIFNSNLVIKEPLTVDLEVVTPDLKHSAIIGATQIKPRNSDPVVVLLPEHIDPGLWFRLSISDQHRFYNFDTLVPSTHSSYQLHQGIQIEQKLYVPGKFLSVKTKGEIDFMKILIEGWEPSSNPLYSSWVEWQLEGAPSQFVDLKLPHLQQDLPEGITMKDLSKKLEVEAFRSGEYGYSDLARGFPWRSNALLAAARGGYEWVKEK